MPKLKINSDEIVDQKVMPLLKDLQKPHFEAFMCDYLIYIREHKLN